MTSRFKLPETKQPNERLYGLTVPLIGLTGGIATGKSTVANYMRQRGLPIIDADALVKLAYQLPHVKDAIGKWCPEAIDAGEINFKILRERFFSDSELKAKVEKLIYDELPALFKKQIQNDAKFVIYDVPLLFERGLDSLSDYSVVVYCPDKMQRKRLMKRDQLSAESADKILSAQWPIERKREAADFVVENTSDLSQLERNVEELLASLFE